MSTPTVNPQPSILDEILAGGGLSFSAAAKLLPAARGRPVSPSTIFRWATTGIKLSGGGVLRLEAVKIGGHHVTSEPALRRFIERQNPTTTDQGQQQAAASVASPRQHGEDVDAAVAACRRHGI